MVKNYLSKIKDYNIRQAMPTPDKTTMLVVDMQCYFKELSEPILKNVLSLIETCRKKGVKIFFTRHGHGDPSRDGGMLREWWGELIIHGTKEWELMEELNPAETEPIIDKNRYSAFFNTSLNDKLRSMEVEDLVISGVMTNCCCETTARDAFVRDYRVFFVADATATVDEELHLASLKNLAYGFAYIVDTKGLCKYLRKI